MQALVGEVEAKSRGRNRRTYIALSLALLAAFGALVYIQTRPRLAWYVSPPIDAQGRRIHVLCPAGLFNGMQANTATWQPSNHLDAREVVLPQSSNALHESMLRKLLIVLHLIANDDGKERLTLSVGRDIYPGLSPLGHYINVDDSAELNASGRIDDRVWVSRTKVVFPGSPEGIRVKYEGAADDDDSTAVGNEICKSLYVK